MHVNPGITFCQSGWIAGEVTLQHRNTVIVGIEIIFQFPSSPAASSSSAKLLVFTEQNAKTSNSCWQHKDYFLLARKSHYGFFQKHN